MVKLPFFRLLTLERNSSIEWLQVTLFLLLEPQWSPEGCPEEVEELTNRSWPNFILHVNVFIIIVCLLSVITSYDDDWDTHRSSSSKSERWYDLLVESLKPDSPACNALGFSNCNISAAHFSMTIFCLLHDQPQMPGSSQEVRVFTAWLIEVHSLGEFVL